MNQQLIDAIGGGVAVALLVYFIKSFFEAIRQDIHKVSKEVSELRGSFEPLRKDIKDNTVALARAQSELNAVWRYVDAPRRRSDAIDAAQNGTGHSD